MLRKFRRSSKVKVEPVQRKDSVASASTSSPRTSSTAVTFFDLPGELRNDIYTLVATTRILYLFHPSSASNKSSSSSSSSSTKAQSQPCIPGLLLASKQSRREYLPILLSIAPLTATITDFNFQPLQRVVGSLYSTELKALRTNAKLIVCLRLRKCSSEVVPGLRRWCAERADSLDRLGWRYVVEEGAPEGRVVWFMERARVLFERVESEGEKWEVRQVLEGLKAQLVGKEGIGRTGGGGYGDDFFFMMATRKFTSGGS